jgi:hypothetical protein
MRIAYMKYCMPIDIGGQGKAHGGTDNRRGVWANLAEAGHQIDIFSPIVGDSKDYPYGKIYRSDAYPSANRYAMLMIEEGPTNVMFSPSGTDEPFLVSTYKKVERFEGKVVYLHGDNLLYFILDLDKFSPRWKELSGNFTTKRLLKNRDFYIFSFANDIDAFQQRLLKTERAGYKYVKQFFTVPPARARWMLPFEAHPKNFLFYAGNQRGRKAKFIKYYGHGKSSVRVAGKWKEEYVDACPKIKWVGRIPQEEVFKELNSSVATIAIGDKTYEDFDGMAPRMFEAVQSGCIMFIDSPQKTAGKVFGKEFVVDSAEDFFERVPALTNIRARDRLVELQRQRVFDESGYDAFTAFGRRFKEICEEIGA